MVGVGFIQRLWAQPFWEDVWPFLDPMFNVCSRTTSVERNAPGKEGSHGELFFFLIQKELVTVLGSET